MQKYNLRSGSSHSKAFSPIIPKQIRFEIDLAKKNPKILKWRN